MLADESEFETKFDAAVEIREDAAKSLKIALQYLSRAEDALIAAAQTVDGKETGKDFDSIIRLEVKLEDIGCDLRSQIERMK